MSLFPSVREKLAEAKTEEEQKSAGCYALGIGVAAIAAIIGALAIGWALLFS